MTRDGLRDWILYAAWFAVVTKPPLALAAFAIGKVALGVSLLCVALNFGMMLAYLHSEER